MAKKVENRDMGRTVCGHCKCVWNTKQEFNQRGKCDEPYCPTNYHPPVQVPGLTEKDTMKVRQAIDQAMEAAANESKKVPPVNLHVVKQVKHHHRCVCETCRAEKRGTPVKEEVKVLQPQAKMRVYTEETETESYYSTGSDTLYLDIPKIRVIKIVPQGGKKNKKGNK